MLTTLKYIVTVAALVVSMSLSAQQLAFPEAQGWGRWAQGARSSSTPTVYHVTNLNDSGTGSLRDAVSQSNRIVVFDVAGIIRLQSRMVFASNLYVAGQTAPGEGITLYGNGVSFSGSSNIICRYLRVRMGHHGDSGKDCAGIARGTNMIFDHCSFSWGLDETFSINPDGKGDLHSITLQNCIIGQGLMTHSAGGLMQADSITLYRNLYIDNSTRNNKVKGINQYCNNIVYNWSDGCYIMGGDSEGQSYCNIESNLFVNGPSKGGNALGGGNSNFHFYGNDNWQDSNMDGQFAPSCIDDTQTGGGDRVATRYPYPELDLYPGKDLIEKNIPTVGASLPYRDPSDCYMIDELMSYGKSGALISNEENLAIGAPDTWPWYSGEKRADSDGDGMPDAWETANGLDANDASDAVKKAANGYLNIENYINSITADSRDYFLRRPFILALGGSTTSTLTLTWRDYTYGEDGFVIEAAAEGGEYQEMARTAAGTTSYTMSGLASGTSYSIRVKAFATVNGEEHTSEAATAVFSTRPVEAGVIDIDSYQPDYTFTGKTNGIWTSSTTNIWTEGKAFEAGKNVLLNNNSNVALQLIVNEEVAPASVVVNGMGKLTLNCLKPLGGEECSLNKGNEGTLIISGSNTYGGATVLHDGVLEFNSIANGGTASAIGASKNFAQNWIFDGGTYRYTGSSAKTDRDARILRETTLEVTKSTSTTLTLNGNFEGSGNLVIDGVGQVAVPTTTFFGYTGETILRGGTLYLSTVDAAKNGIGKSSRLVLAGGTLQTKGETSGYETYSFPVVAEENTYSYFKPNRLCYMNNTLTGAGTIEIVIPYQREYFNMNTAGFTGRIVANGVDTSSKWGALFLKESSYDIPTTIVHLTGNARMCVWSTNASNNLGGLSGDNGTYLMACSKNTTTAVSNWTIGSANSDETFNGIINNNCCAEGGGYNAKENNITKVGTGLWRLTGKNVYQGTTAIDGGKLVVNGQHTGTGAYNVNKDATLAGKGSVAGAVTCASGSTVEPGDTLVDGSQLTMTASLMMRAGSTLQIDALANGKTNSLCVTGQFYNSGATLYMNIDPTSGTVANGTEFRVFTAGSLAGTGFGEITPEQPSASQRWDTSRLLTDGVIIVTSASDGISQVSADDNTNADAVYDLGGQRVSGSARGIVISKGKKIIK